MLHNSKLCKIFAFLVIFLLSKEYRLVCGVTGVSQELDWTIWAAIWEKNFGHICLKSGHPGKYRVRRSLCKLGCRVLFCFIFATLPLLNLSTDLRRKTKTHHNVWKSLDKRSTVSLCVVVHIVKKIILVDLWVKKENSCLEFSHTWLKAFLGGDFDWEPWKRAQIEFWHPQCHKKVIRLKMPCFENCQ